MELSDLTPEDVELLQRPGKQLIQDFLNNNIVQEQTEHIMSQKAVTDTIDDLSDSVEDLVSNTANNILETVENTYQHIGDYATNNKVDNNKQIADDKDAATNARIDTTNQNVVANTTAISNEKQIRISEINRIAGLVSAETAARTTADSNLSERISSEVNARQSNDNILAGAINTINNKIPSEASNSNKLADKKYVDDSIPTKISDIDNDAGFITARLDVDVLVLE